MRGQCAREGFGDLADLEQLPFATWYGVLESWFVDAHATAMWSRARVLEWLTDELPAEWERQYPDPETHGTTQRQRESAAKAEAMYGATG